MREELRVRLHKIHGQLLEDLNALLPDFGAHKVFANQNRLEDRLRRIGWTEFSSILASQNCQLLQNPPTPVYDWDWAIISLYEAFAQSPGRKIILFSSDNEFISQWRNLDILTDVPS